MSGNELEGHVVIIVGSSRGIGAAAARVAHRQGARVILHGRSESPQLVRLAAELDARYLTCDVADRDAVHAAVAELTRDEPVIHGLINCAGHVNPKPFLDCTQEDWLLELNVNLLGTAYFCQAVAPIMVRRGYGRIVNVASLRGKTITAAARGVAYSAAKAGVINLTAALAKEFAPTINVNAVAPGFIHTDMSDNWNETVWDQARSALVGRVGRPEDIGEVLAFLASHRAAFITGQTIMADGGYTMAGK